MARNRTFVPALAGATAGPWVGAGSAGLPSRAAATGADRSGALAGAQAPWDDAPVSLDATLYRPASTPAPAIVLAHGFGGSKDSVAEQAQDLAGQGYIVMAYTARGFGASTGTISLDSLDAEVPDASKVVDYLAQRDEVAKRDGDPIVGVVGGSYGGALALMLASTDQRIDAVVSTIAWNNLQESLFPTAEAGAAEPGVLKRQWVSSLFGSATPAPGQAATAAGCGRLQVELCDAYAEALKTGSPNPKLSAWFARSSPVTVLASATAPTLLVQGEQDTLFGLDQADATAKTLLQNEVPVAVHWFAGGHGSADLDDRSRERVSQWLDHYLKSNPARGDRASTDFQFAVGGTRAQNRVRWYESSRYPLTLAGPSEQIRLTDPATNRPQVITNPVGGLPQAITSVPGLSGVGDPGATTLDLGAALAGRQPPGQAAIFTSQTLPNSRLIVGPATVRFRVTAVQSHDDESNSQPVLFASIGAQQAGAGEADPQRSDPQQRAGEPSTFLGPALSIAGGQVTPVRLPALAAGQSELVTARLPWVVLRVNAGDRVGVRIATTDAGFPAAPAGAQYRVSEVSAITVNPPVGQPIGAANLSLPVLVALTSLLLAGIGGLWWAGRNPPRPALVSRTGENPLTVTRLSKSYGEAQVVREVSFSVSPGRVVGLLGPNGAGKTTTLRMVLGLIEPTDGSIEVFGERLTPGHPQLSRIGALVEGSGFLPHVSGERNLELYWQATGRDARTAKLPEVLALAGLGEAVHKPVGTYSQGMRQRLAIAQAMLGLPELLILDEPTNGLDPPQIHAMRTSLREYAAAGRTVLVSSHLLSEVEQTCDDVVVIHQGRTVAAESVAALTSSAWQLNGGELNGGELNDGQVNDGQSNLVQPNLVQLNFVLPEVAQAAQILRDLSGVSEIREQAGSVQATVTDPTAAIKALIDAGLSVQQVTPARRLEDVFLQLISS